VRAFVAVWPPAAVVAALGTMERPAHPDVRWTPESGWHVTLAFLGDLATSEIPALTRALAEAGRRCPSPTAVLGPATERGGAGVLWLPVGGLGPLAAAVRAAVVPFGHHGGEPFLGHLTVARARGRRRLPAALSGVPLAARWEVGEISLVTSRLDPAGARYEVVGRARLAPP